MKSNGGHLDKILTLDHIDNVMMMKQQVPNNNNTSKQGSMYNTTMKS
jgi:hypothetical protein